MMINSVTDLRNIIDSQADRKVKVSSSVLCDYFQQSLVEEKHLNKDQESVISKKIKDLVSLAVFNLGMSNPLRARSLNTREIKKISDEMVNMTLSVKNPVPLYSLVNKKLTLIGPMLQFLLSPELPSLTDTLKWRVFKAIFIQRDEGLLKEARDQWRDLFVSLYQQIKNSNDPAERLTQESVIAYLLSLFPHFAPAIGEEISVPQFVDGAWRLCDYRVDRIQLTASYVGSPIYAYGLQGTYLDEDGIPRKAPPNLLFKGTTFPTDDGAFLSLFADVNPFGSVGEYAFKSGREALQHWFNRATDEKVKARLSGLSLGGSLVSIASEEFRDQIEFSHAYNPPALRSGLVHANAKNQPNVRVLWQNRDIVACAGWKWNPNWDIISILSEKKYNSFVAHCKAFSGEENMMMVKLNTDRVNQWWVRKMVAILHSVASIPAFVFLSIVFIVYRLFQELILFPVCFITASMKQTILK